MSTRLKKEFLRLLKEDEEFRYTVIGYLGLAELLKNIEKLWENQNRLWEEVKALREEVSKLWENQNRLWEEVKALREEVSKLWENQNRLWEEVRDLRKDFIMFDKRLTSLEKRIDRLEKGMGSLAKAVGVTLDHYTATFVEEILRSSGIPEDKIDVRVEVVLSFKDIEREVDIFNKDPLVVGEVTTYIDSIENARKELNKVLEDIKFAESIFNRRVFMAILAVENIPKDVAEFLEEECRRHGIKLIYGKEIEKL
ncbi:MAG: hypothetical protein QXZ16_02710 [Ignisphaera sp.]